MPTLESRVVPQSETYRQNHAALSNLVARLRALEARTREKSEASRERFERRGQLLPGDRLGRPRWPASVWTMPTLSAPLQAVV
jgi:geranyl-CoA carboxylase beta subunit